MTKPDIISSLDNLQIKQLKKLTLKKYRQETGMFMVENLVIIRDALKANFVFESLFVTEEFTLMHKKELTELLAGAKNYSYFLITEKLNKHYSNLETPSGITAVFKVSPSKFDSQKIIIYLNGINDPGNLGTILRSALAFNFKNFILDETCADIYNAKTINAAKDAIFKINLFYDKNRAWLEENHSDYPIYTTSSHVGKVLSAFTPAKKFCLVLGSESHGISNEIIKLADEQIKIEISQEIESLNVATAAAILFYYFSK